MHKGRKFRCLGHSQETSAPPDLPMCGPTVGRITREFLPVDLGPLRTNSNMAVMMLCVLALKEGKTDLLSARQGLTCPHWQRSTESVLLAPMRI